MSRESYGYWGLINPAFFWLFFVPPFLAYALGCCPGIIGACVATSACAFLLFRQPDRPFSALFYVVPLMALFAAYVLPVKYALVSLLVANIWMNFAVFFPVGKSAARIRESLFASRLLGLFFILYIATLILADIKWVDSPLYLGWLPALLPVLVYAALVLRNYFKPTRREVVSLLPLVRVAVVRGDKLLVRCGAEDSEVDLPFSFPVHPGEVPYEVAEQKLQRLTRRVPKFLLKYREKTSEGEHVVFLFVLNLKHGENFDDVCCAENECTFLGPEQLEAAAMSRQLREEYAYLSSTIFLTNRMLSRL